MATGFFSLSIRVSAVTILDVSCQPVVKIGRFCLSMYKLKAFWASERNTPGGHECSMPLRLGWHRESNGAKRCGRGCRLMPSGNFTLNGLGHTNLSRGGNGVFRNFHGRVVDRSFGDKQHINMIVSHGGQNIFVKCIYDTDQACMNSHPRLRLGAFVSVVGAVPDQAAGMQGAYIKQGAGAIVPMFRSSTSIRTRAWARLSAHCTSMSTGAP